MTDIVFTSLTGFPTPHTGGGNRIIHDIIKNISVEEFSRKYASFTFQKNYGIRNELGDPLQMLNVSQTFGRYAFQTFPLYKKIVTSPLYTRWYFDRVERRFQNYFSKNNSKIIHSHHPLAFPQHSGAKQQKILTIHSKGGFVYENKMKGFDSHFSQKHFSTIAEKERTSVLGADRLTFPSIAAKELFFRVNDIDCTEEKIQIIYNGVDVDAIQRIQPDTSIFRRYGIRENAEVHILNVAEHAPQKNIPSLIQSVNYLVKEKKKDVVLINVGTGEETDQLRAMVNELDLVHNVKFLGSLPNSDVITLMKVCDCFVLVSTEVIFDLVVLEALASGAAIFVSDDGGNREVIRNKFNGYLIDPHNTMALIDALTAYDRDSIRKNTLQSAARFTIKAMVGQYENLYKELTRQ